MGNDIYHLKITANGRCGDAKSKSYRILSIPAELTLYKLASEIIGSFDFDFDHCFGFFDPKTHWAKAVKGYEYFSDIGEESRHPGVEKTTIKEALENIGNKMTFLFDYGDEWLFTVEQTETIKGGGKSRPALVKSVGRAPKQY